MTFKKLLARSASLLSWGGSIELVSAPGRGKSSIVEQIAASQGRDFGLAVCFLGTAQPYDLPGYMIPSKDERGRDVATFTLPMWAECRQGGTVFDYPRGILFLDEFGQADPDTKKTAADLLLNKRVGKWQLPPGWVVWAASNRTSDRSGVTKSFDFVINRRGEIHISDDVESWNDWAMASGVHPSIVAFTNSNPQVVFTDGVPDKQGPWCTPRSLVEAARFLKAAAGPDGKLPTEADVVEIVSGIIGQGAAAQLMAYLRLAGQLPQFADIIRDPQNAKVPDQPDGRMLVTYSLASRVDATNAQAVVDYMERLPKEFATTFVKAACKRDVAFVNTAAFGGWATRNASLLAAVHAA